MSKQKHVETSLTAVPQPQLPALASPAYIQPSKQGLEHVHAEDVKMPYLKLSQDKTDLVADGKLKVGHYYNSVTGQDFGEEVEIIPVAVTKARVLWEKFDESTGVPLCKSVDCLHGSAVGVARVDAPDTKSTGDCMSCPCASWSEKKNGSAKPPLCTEQGQIMVTIPGAQAPMVLNLSNSSYPAYRGAVSIMAAKTGLPAYANLLKLSVIKKKTDSGEVFAAKASDTGRFPTEDEYKKAEAIYNSMKEAFYRASETNPVAE